MRSLAFLTFTSVAALPSLVWQGGSGPSLLSVFSDDTYSYSLLNSTLLTSGTSSFYINGQWWLTSPPSPGGACSRNLTDTDCHGNDLYYFNTTSVAECCANCSATPSCGAYTFTGETAQQPASAAGSPPYWANRCYIKSSCAGAQSYPGHTSGTQPPAASSLTRLGAGPLSGTHPTLGSYTGWELRYTAGGASATPLTLSFLYYAASGLLLFNTTLPTGAGGMSLLTPGGNGGGGEFSASQQPSTQFPAFAVAPAVSYVGWQGRFFGSVAGAWGAGASTGGAEGGPLVLYPTPSSNHSAGAPIPAAVLAPFNHFKSNMLGAPVGGLPQPASLVAGLNSYVTAVPPGYMLSTSLTASEQGITDAMHGWGQLLLQARGTTRQADPASTALTYWTDNVRQPHCRTSCLQAS